MAVPQVDDRHAARQYGLRPVIQRLGQPALVRQAVLDLEPRPVEDTQAANSSPILLPDGAHFTELFEPPPVGEQTPWFLRQDHQIDV